MCTMYHGQFFLQPTDAVLSLNSPSIYGSESTDQKKEIEEEISKAVVYVYAFEVVLFENLWTR